MRPKISVIIPVYNAEKYLRKCINSVLTQTYDNLEIILIDDGSTDHSAEMCDYFQKKDNRIVVVHKSNEGVSDARNLGLEISTGKYIAFLDSDDYIVSTCIEELYNSIVTNDADISWGNFLYVYENKEPKEQKNSVEKVVESKNIVKDFLSTNLAFGYCCGKLFNSEVINNIRFQGFRVAEDELFIYMALKNCERISFVDKPLYCYRQNDESVMHSGNKKLYDMVRVAQIIKEDVESDLKSYSECLLTTNAVYTYCRLYNTNCSEELAECKSVVKKYRRRIVFSKCAPLKLKVSCGVSYMGFAVMVRAFFLYKKFSAGV